MHYLVIAVVLFVLSIVADSAVYALSLMLDGALVASGIFFLFLYKKNQDKDKQG